MKPLADFVCNSRGCRTDEGEAPMFEAPLDAKVCPYGHKAIRRLFNKVAVIGLRGAQPDLDSRLTSNSRFARSQVALQPAFDHADAHKLQDRSMRSYELHSAPPEVRATIAKQLSGQGGKGRPMTQVEIRSALARDRYAPSSIMAQQWDHGIPSWVKR